MSQPKGLFVLDETSRQMIYGPQEVTDIANRVDLYVPPQNKASVTACPELLREADFIFSGWGAPLFDDALLDAAPNLKVLFYGAGAVSSVITPAVWERGIQVTSAYAANARPVAEFTIAAMLFSLKHAWKLSRQTHQLRQFVPRDGAPGAYRRNVGLISLGMTARTVLELLRPYDLNVLVWDPYLSESEAHRLQVQLVSLHDMFSRCDVVSLHTPLLPETHDMIGAEHFRLMKTDATFINTARGQIVRELELIDVLQQRPDLTAVLDVTADEPPRSDSPLYTMPNVVLTPHIAGSVGQECRRMGRYMVEELDRHLTGKPLRWLVTPELAQHSSHRPTCMESAPRAKPQAIAVV